MVDNKQGVRMMNGANDSEPYAFHTDGINGTLGDGSSRFLRRSISPATMAAICNRAGGEIPGNDW